MSGSTLARRFALGALAVGVSVVGVGCGDDEEASPATTVAGSIVDEVNDACRAQQAAFDERPPFPVEGFDPQRPDPAVLPEVGAYFEDANGISEEFLARLEAIDAPPAEAAALAAYLDAAREDFQVAKDQQAAAADRDAEAFVATLARVTALTDEANRLARDLGADDCVVE